MAASARLVVADREREDPALAGLGLTWLACVALDRSTPLRGIAVMEAGKAVARGRVPVLSGIAEFTSAFVRDNEAPR